jgi:HEAT repeat protein
MPSEHPEMKRPRVERPRWGLLAAVGVVIALQAFSGRPDAARICFAQDEPGKDSPSEDSKKEPQDKDSDAAKGDKDAPEEGKAPDAAATPPSLEELKARYTAEKTKEAYERIPTVEQIGAVRTKEAVTFLAGLFGSEAFGSALASAATRSLGRIGTEEAAHALVQKALPFFLEPPIPPGSSPEVSKQLKEEGHFFLELTEPGLAGPWDPKAEEWLLKSALTPEVRKDDLAVSLLLRAFAKFKSKNRIPLLLAEVTKSKSTKLQVSILDGFRESGLHDEKILQTGLYFTKSADTDVQIAAYDLLGTAAPAKHRGLFVAGLGHPNWEVRVICIDSLSATKDKDLVKHASKLLKDPDKRVAISAVRALLDRATPDVIEPLYKDLGTAEGRLQDDIADALARLTGVNFGVNPTQWESWWAQKKSTMKTLQPLTAEQLVELKTKEKEQITQSTPLYFGLRIRSDSIAFLVDCSESMNEEYKPAGAAPEPAVAKGKTTVAKKAEPEPGAKRGTTSTAKARKKRPGWKSRLDVAKKELTEAISRLPEGQVLNVIRFNSLLSDFCATVFPETQQTKTPPGLNPDVRTKVIDYVKASKAEGLTNVLGAVREAFKYPQVDTIYLLSDGAPTVGVTDRDELLRELDRMNRRRKVKINAISFHPKPEERQLLQAIAVRTMGVYVER